MTLPATANPSPAAPEENGSTALLASATPETKIQALDTAVLPTSVRALFNDPALLITEDAETVDAIVRLLGKLIHPDDVMGWVLAASFVQSEVEVRRLRKFKAGVIELKRTERAYRIDAGEDSYLKDDPYAKAAAIWGDGGTHKDESPLRTPKKRRKRKPLPTLNTDQDSTFAFLDCIDTYERVHRLLASVEATRNECWRDLQRHCEAGGRRRTRATAIIDAERSDIPPPVG
jgi:hypothetical protein